MTGPIDTFHLKGRIMKYVIQAGEYYLIPKGQRRGGYTWRKGRPGQEMAARFQRRRDAQMIIDTVASGAGGRTARVVRVES